jgi:hypothetical protein
VDSYSYRRAVASVLADAADRRIIEPVVRIKPGTLARDITDFGSALYLVDRLIENDRDPRWWTLEPLQPELGHCIAWLRRAQRFDAMVPHGLEILRSLRHKTSLPVPGRGAAGSRGSPVVRLVSRS